MMNKSSTISTTKLQASIFYVYTHRERETEREKMLILGESIGKAKLVPTN